MKAQELIDSIYDEWGDLGQLVNNPEVWVRVDGVLYPVTDLEVSATDKPPDRLVLLVKESE